MGQPDDVLGDGVRGRRGRRDPRSASTVVGPLYGKLGDLYGRKRVLQAALVLFLVGSALCGLAQSMLQLTLSRAVQGLGGQGRLGTNCS